MREMVLDEVDGPATLRSQFLGHRPRSVSGVEIGCDDGTACGAQVQKVTEPFSPGIR